MQVNPSVTDIIESLVAEMFFEDPRLVASCDINNAVAGNNLCKYTPVLNKLP